MMMVRIGSIDRIRRVETVRAKMGIVHRSSHRDRLVKVGVLAKHCTELQCLIVVSVLLASGR